MNVGLAIPCRIPFLFRLKALLQKLIMAINLLLLSLCPIFVPMLNYITGKISMNKMYSLAALLCAALSAPAQQKAIEVQPVPQVVTCQEQTIVLPGTYRMEGDAEANPHAVRQLKQLLPGEYAAREGLRVYIGERGDKSVKKYARYIPRKEEGYLLRINGREIVLAGNDERGTYYAVQTFARLLKDGQLPTVEITDYPTIRFRGVVEGFYGTPWSHEARLSQLRFYGENKMNTYIYGPKDDPYHSSPNWRKPYPEKEARQLQELVNVARENEVDFVWAIHPGLDIKWNDEDRDLLLQKFESMYQLGVRSFAVFFDDISGEGTNPQRQAELLNYIDEQFVNAKPDVKPLIMCPTEYNKSWSNPKGGYLATLGEKLNPGIQVMWTGDRVISDITREGVAWINGFIKRPAYIWWNFPVSDYVRDHLLLGPVYGLEQPEENSMSGFVTNPMEHAEASKIAIYGVASYAWNPQGFDSNKAWRDAICNILPTAADELEFFASHCSDLGPNGHGYRRDESVALQPVAATFKDVYVKHGRTDNESAAVLQETFARMVEVADILATEPGNLPLTAELKPWLEQFRLLGQAGCGVMEMVKALEQDAPSLFLRKYKHVKALQQQMFTVDQTYNQNPYQPGVKVASKVVKPLVDETFQTVVQRYNKRYEAALDAKTDYMPHTLTSDVPQLKNLPLQQKANRIQVSPALEIIKWPAQAFLSLELDKAYPVLNVDIDFGVAEVAGWGILEVSVDGKEWQRVDFIQKGNRLTADLKKQTVKFVRFTNGGNGEQQVRLGRFAVLIEK